MAKKSFAFPKRIGFWFDYFAVTKKKTPRLLVTRSSASRDDLTSFDNGDKAFNVANKSVGSTEVVCEFGNEGEAYT